MHAKLEWAGRESYLVFNSFAFRIRVLEIYSCPLILKLIILQDKFEKLNV
jgi:hypothetical protein